MTELQAGTIRLFVGCSANGEDAEAQALLEYSLRKHASRRVEITWMQLSHDPASPWYSNPAKGEGWNTQGWATPFSAFRWGIPHVCGYSGKAIYMDVDMLPMDDIAKLWDQTIPGKSALLAKNETTSCVMLFDCSRMKPLLPPFDQLRKTAGLYRQVRKNVGLAVAKFQNNWNCLDGEHYASLDDPDIKILHFTKVETQPHLKYALPRLHANGLKHWNEYSGAKVGIPHPRKDVQPLVDKLWAEAQAAGYTVEKYLPAKPFGNYNQVRGSKAA